MARDQASSTAGAGLKCPKCGAPREPGSEQCPACDIVFAKWSARQLGRTDIPKAGRTARPASSSLPRLVVIGGTVLLLCGSLWALTRTPSVPEEAGAGPAPTGDQLVVHYLDGHQCLLGDWSFEYKRTFNRAPTKQGPWVVHDYNTYAETKNDDVLRFYATQGSLPGRKRDFLSHEIEEIRFDYLAADPESPSTVTREISGLTLVTAAETVEFPPSETPSSYRKRFVVPLSSYYFPEHFDDQDWDRRRAFTVSLVGTLQSECDGYERISLTEDRVPNFAVPERIEFPGG